MAKASAARTIACKKNLSMWLRLRMRRQRQCLCSAIQIGGVFALEAAFVTNKISRLVPVRIAFAGDGWKLKHIGDVKPGAWYVDGKRIDPSKPYDPDAPPFNPEEKRPKWERGQRLGWASSEQQRSVMLCVSADMI